MKRLIRSAVCCLLCLALIAVSVPLISVSAVKYYPTAELLKIKSHIEKDAGMNEYATVQGACTDGRYAYFAVQSGNTVILKYDLKTWKLKKKASVYGLGHANDMAYNSKKDVIVVANNYASDDLVTYLDPDTLKVAGTATPKVKKTDKEIKKEAKEKNIPENKVEKYKKLEIYCIAYDEAHDRYVAGLSGSYDFVFLDGAFRQTKRFKGVKTDYTRQGCDCDDEHIYFTQSGGSNAVVIYDYKGKQVDMISLGNTHEVENLFHVGSDFYLTLHYYGNFVHRAGFSDDTKITFAVRYDPGEGTGKMKDTKAHYGGETKLRECTFVRPGYFFGGWKVRRDSDGCVMGYALGSDERDWLKEGELYNYRLYRDSAPVSKLVKFGSATLTAFWINERYGIYFDSDGGEGRMDPAYVNYAEEYTLPQNGFTKQGYIFRGYTAFRACDGRVYGCAKDSDKPEWLRIEDVRREYYFSPGDKVEKLSFDGDVLFTARFTYAFIFDDNAETLLSYVGEDEYVDIPDAEGSLRAISSNAFDGNEMMTELCVPACVNTIEKGAVNSCSNLRSICFEGRFPDDFDAEAVIDSGSPFVYEEVGGVRLCLGFLHDKYNAALIRRNASAFESGYGKYIYDEYYSKLE